MTKPSNFFPAKRVLKLKEDDIQSGFVMWFGLQFPQYRRLIHHSPNEDAYKHARRANSMGMQVGFPDLFIAIPRGIYHGLFIELKTQRGRASAEQREMLALLSGQGYFCAICHGVEAAIRTASGYLALSSGEAL